MRNRSILWTFVILLAVAVLYSLSFGWVASRYEKNIHQMALDSIASAGLEGEAADIAVFDLERKLLRDSADAKAYPLFDHTYSYLKQHELNLGLDLKGGMSVTLEVSIPDLIIALSDYNETPAFTNAIKDAVAAQKN
jgi:SecD/SecF fusion protein